MRAATKDDEPVAYVRQALAEDAFALFCQPICALGTPLTFPMAEALVRLREEEAARCPPGEFLPVLEHYGLMPDLDRWVVRQALGHLAEGTHPMISVNVARQTLADVAFPAFVAQELEAAGVAGDRLLFEVEEDDVLLRPQITARFASTAGALGCRIIIDGFGRGGDFIEPLKLPSLGYLKLCFGLTRLIAAPGALEEELRALLQVTAGMDIPIIAECVEDTATLMALRRRGVRFAQGFGVGAPRPMKAG